MARDGRGNAEGNPVPPQKANAVPAACMIRAMQEEPSTNEGSTSHCLPGHCMLRRLHRTTMNRARLHGRRDFTYGQTHADNATQSGASRRRDHVNSNVKTTDQNSQAAAAVW